MPETVDGDVFDPPVFITEALTRRPARKADHLQEKQALQELAARMVDEPAAVLPRFVDLAMAMTGGTAAGISLYEGGPPPGLFRWHYLRGRLARFDGAVTPRNFSPCGITLDCMTPILTSHPERMYDWIAEAGIAVPEVLLVPLFIRGREPLGTLWIVSDEEEHFDSGDARVATELSTFVGLALRMLQTERSLIDALDEQKMLAAEMNHRVKNAFALIQGLIHVSMRGAKDPGDMARSLSGRLRALADAHALTSRESRDPGAGPETADLASLLAVIVGAYVGVDGQPRVALRGPPIRCREGAVNGIALIFHELATNCAKYGALQAESGGVEVEWRVEGGRLAITWCEHGGPPILAPPAATGFGSRLLQSTITQRFGGELRHEWNRDGLRATIAIPTDRVLDPAVAASA
ncbi:histidine kinase [Allostella sp. ATCC 35155]|nr:histidine kinase [Stella sp. ATCC 35155]